MVKNLGRFYLHLSSSFNPPTDTWHVEECLINETCTIWLMRVQQYSGLWGVRWSTLAQLNKKYYLYKSVLMLLSCHIKHTNQLLSGKLNARWNPGYSEPKPDYTLIPKQLEIVKQQQIHFNLFKHILNQ